jgi:hypothetical protein
MQQHAPDLTTLVRNLVRLNGGDPTSYEACILADGSIVVRNATTTVYYVQDGWISKFNRHLHRGFFEAPAHAATPHAVGVNGRG